MQPMTRLFLVGILLCMGLQIGEVQPAHAYKKSTYKYYIGTVTLRARGSTQRSSSGGGLSLKGKIDIVWELNGSLKLRITNGKDHWFSMPGKLSGPITQDVSSKVTAKGQNCYAISDIYAKGGYLSEALLPLTDNYNNYDGKSFKLPLRWLGETDSKVKFWGATGSIPNCNETWGKKLTEAEKNAISDYSKNIKEIVFRVTISSPEVMGGTCDLPGWTAEFQVTDGTVKRSLPMCEWHVRKVGAQEWEQQ